MVSATTSMAMAAQTALPGDTLYPLKRALENASTTIQIDEDAKGSSLLDHATGRLDEVDEPTRQGDEPNADVVADTLRAFAEQASSASDLLFEAYAESGQESDIEELRAFTAQSMAALNELETVVPDTARAALIEAAQVVNLIDTAAFQVCPSCGDGAAQMPEFEAAASVPELLNNLGSALEAPLTGAQPTKSPDKGDGDKSGDKSKGPHKGGQPDQPVDLPDSPVVTTNGGVDPGGNPGGSSESNVIEDLTDRLTGGGGGVLATPASRTCSTRRSTPSSAACSGTSSPGGQRKTDCRFISDVYSVCWIVSRTWSVTSKTSIGSSAAPSS